MAVKPRKSKSRKPAAKRSKSSKPRPKTPGAAPKRRQSDGSPSSSKPVGSKRERLSRERVLRTAMALADESGVDALSMRKLGQALGVEAMSLYGHVANKEAILDGIVGLVSDEIEMPIEGVDWRESMRARAISTYRVLLRHPWAASLMESRTNPIPSRTRACDAVIGVLRSAGFSIRHAYHAFLTLDSYIYGFALQQVNWPYEKDELAVAVDAYERSLPEGQYPHIREMVRFVLAERRADAIAGKTSPDYAPEFEFGLDLILDGFERLRGAT